MLQIKKLNLTHKKDLRVILDDFNLVLNDGDKAVIIGEEGKESLSDISGQLSMDCSGSCSDGTSHKP